METFVSVAATEEWCLFFSPVCGMCAVRGVKLLYSFVEFDKDKLTPGDIVFDKQTRIPVWITLQKRKEITENEVHCYNFT